MVDAILNFFSSLDSGNIIIITILVAMIPVIEVKGAIPFAASTKFWGKAALSVWEAFLYSFIGSAIIAIGLILLYKQLLKLLLKLKITRKIAHKISAKLNLHKDGITDQVNHSKLNKRIATAIAIGIFVAVPLPLTGVWTAACLCTVLQMPVLDSILSVVIGNAVCGIIITLVSLQFEAYTHIILLVILILALVLFVGKVVLGIVKKHKLAKNLVAETNSTDKTDINNA
ncbi:MAG: small multi-drug export protein [Clostridia bacterium]|nr:small multi-drug export protein [Clostridia bacterium]